MFRRLVCRGGVRTSVFFVRYGWRYGGWRIGDVSGEREGNGEDKGIGDGRGGLGRGKKTYLIERKSRIAWDSKVVI